MDMGGFMIKKERLSPSCGSHTAVSVLAVGVDGGTAAASVKPAQYETKQTATTGRAALQLILSCSTLSALIPDIRDNTIRAQMWPEYVEKTAPRSTSKQSTAFSPRRCRVR